MNKKLMTAKAISEITGFHARTVSKMGRSGEIPGAVLIGKHVRFDARRVNDFFEHGGCLEHKSTSTVIASAIQKIRKPGERK